MKNKILRLDETLLIGKGGVREVYQHPDDPLKCIKITFNQKKQRSVKREINSLRLYHLRKKPFERITRFHGYCLTTKGKGMVFDLIRDFDGKKSVMLSDHVAGKAEPCLQPAEIVYLLNDLFEHLLQHNIIISDPAPHNILVHYTSENKKKLVLVDGIGNPQFIKLADFSTHYAHKIIKDKWRYYIEENASLKQIFAITGYKR